MFDDTLKEVQRLRSKVVGEILVQENGSGEIFISRANAGVRIGRKGDGLIVSLDKGLMIPSEVHGLPAVRIVTG